MNCIRVRFGTRWESVTASLLLYVQVRSLPVTGGAYMSGISGIMSGQMTASDPSGVFFIYVSFLRRRARQPPNEKHCVIQAQCFYVLKYWSFCPYLSHKPMASFSGTPGVWGRKYPSLHISGNTQISAPDSLARRQHAMPFLRLPSREPSDWICSRAIFIVSSKP